MKAELTRKQHLQFDLAGDALKILVQEVMTEWAKEDRENWKSHTIFQIHEIPWKYMNLIGKMYDKDPKEGHCFICESGNGGIQVYGTTDETFDNIEIYLSRIDSNYGKTVEFDWKTLIDRCTKYHTVG